MASAVSLREAHRFVAGSPNSLRVAKLTENEWPRLENIRLVALRDDPSSFLSSYELEVAYDEQRWREEFSRGEWNIMLAGDKEIGLLGVTREETMPAEECYLEYLWIAPDFRRTGMGSALLRTVLEDVRQAGVRTVWLYILNGNHGAMNFYQKFGFQSTNERQLLPGHPAGSEERMKLRLA
jgi:ribosomal protein S18 acetylase RimI-like enzyme